MKKKITLLDALSLVLGTVFLIRFITIDPLAESAGPTSLIFLCMALAAFLYSIKNHAEGISSWLGLELDDADDMI